MPKNLEGESQSKVYTYIQSEYVGNINNIKLLKARVLAYDMMAPFIIPYLLDEYAPEVEYFWGNRDTTGVNLFKHWSNISLQQAILFQRGSYGHCVNNADIVRCEQTLELFVNSNDGALINRIEEK